MKVTITLEDQDQGMSLDINYGGPKDPTSHAAYMAGEFLRLIDSQAKASDSKALDESGH